MVAVTDLYLCLCGCSEVFECEYKNGGCFHYCKDSQPVGSSVTCSCADGYELEEDGKSCKVTGNKNKQYTKTIITLYL